MTRCRCTARRSSGHRPRRPVRGCCHRLSVTTRSTRSGWVPPAARHCWSSPTSQRSPRRPGPAGPTRDATARHGQLAPQPTHAHRSSPSPVTVHPKDLVHLVLCEVSRHTGCCQYQVPEQLDLLGKHLVVEFAGDVGIQGAPSLLWRPVRLAPSIAECPPLVRSAKWLVVIVRPRWVLANSGHQRARSAQQRRRSDAG